MQLFDEGEQQRKLTHRDKARRIGWLIKEAVNIGTHANGNIVGISLSDKKYTGVVEVTLDLGGAKQPKDKRRS